MYQSTLLTIPEDSNLHQHDLTASDLATSFTQSKINATKIVGFLAQV